MRSKQAKGPCILLLALAGVFFSTGGASAIEVLKGMGRNSEGQLGVGIHPQKVIDSGVATVAAGTYHTLFVMQDGNAWAMGANYSGELGDGSKVNRHVPVPIATGALSVAAGEYTSMLLKTDGTLWTTKFLNNGTANVFTQSDSGVTRMAMGSYHGVWVKADGSMWGIGTNYYGELGAGAGGTSVHHTPKQMDSGVTDVAAGWCNTFYIRTDGSLWVMGESYGGVARQIASDVIAVDAGERHAVFIKADGRLWAIGKNYDGQLGTGDNADRSTPVKIADGVRAVNAGQATSLFIKHDGTLWGMGRNSVSILGDGTNLSRNVPVKIATKVVSVAAGGAMTLFTRTDGSLWATGADDYGQLGDDGARGSKVPVTIATGVEGMTAGSYAGGFTKDQKWWGFGFDGIVNPGGGTKPLPVAENGVARVAASSRHRLILKMDGTLQAQGENDHGKLGDGSQIDRPAPVTISGNVNGIGVGENYSLFVRADGHAYGMGSIFWGVNISAPPVLLGMDAAGVSASPYHAFLLKRNGDLRAFGDNSYGQLGTGYSGGVVSSGDVVQAAGGMYHSLFVKTDGSLWVMGRNEKGQLGDGLGADRGTPFKLLEAGVVAVAAGNRHSIFLKSDGSLWGMGANERGQLGLGDLVDRMVPVKIADQVTGIAAGYTHTLFTQTRSARGVYEDWASARGLTGDDAAPTASPGDDGIPNSLLYAFNLPREEPASLLSRDSGNAGFPFIGLETGAERSVFRFEYLRRRDSGLQYVPQSSSSLLPGSFVTMTAAGQVTPIDHQWERVVIEEPCDPSSTPAMFGRVAVTLPAE